MTDSIGTRASYSSKDSTWFSPFFDESQDEYELIWDCRGEITSSPGQPSRVLVKKNKVSTELADLLLRRKTRSMDAQIAKVKELQKSQRPKPS